MQENRTSVNVRLSIGGGGQSRDYDVHGHGTKGSMSSHDGVIQKAILKAIPLIGATFAYSAVSAVRCRFDYVTLPGTNSLTKKNPSSSALPSTDSCAGVHVRTVRSRAFFDRSVPLPHDLCQISKQDIPALFCL